MIINDLIDRFRIQIRDNGTTQALQDPEVEQFIEDGLRTYSKYRPLKKSLTINVVQGQLTYTLPNDWIDREYSSFEKAINPPGEVFYPRFGSPFTMVSVTELRARPMAYQEDVEYRFYNDSLQLVINPVPQMSYDLTFDYYAYHMADENGVTVPYIDIDNALLPGLAKSLESIATDYSVKLQMYKMGNNIQVDNRTLAQQLSDRAKALMDRFERDIIKRPISIMG